MVRRAVAAAAAVVVLSTVTGCSPDVGAVLGVGLDAQGRPVGAVHVCDHDVVTAELYAGDRLVGSWERAAPVRGTDTWRLVDPVSPWRSTRGTFAALDPGAAYTLSAWSADRGHRSNHLEFTARELARLGPGELLVERYSAPQRGSGIETRLEVVDAQQLDQERCWR